MEFIENKVYITKNGTVLTTPPNDGTSYYVYIHRPYIIALLEKLRKVCGNSAMRFVTKEIELIKKN